MNDVGRVPPQNIEAEQAVLGAIMTNDSAIHCAVELLVPIDFYRTVHQTIFEACINLFGRGEAIDLVTVTEELQKMNALEDIGGASYVVHLVDTVPPAAHVEYHARIIRDKAMLRSLIEAAQRIANRAFEADEDVDLVMDESEHAIFQISQGRSSLALEPVGSGIPSSIAKIEKLSEHKIEVTGVPTGLKDLDALLSGLQDTDLILVAGRPGSGKSSLCLDMAMHAAIDAHRTVAFFSMEMSREQLIQRMLASKARIPLHWLRRGFLRDRDWANLTAAAGLLVDSPIFVDDTPGITILEMKAKARRLRSEHGLNLIVVDYIQLMQSRKRVENRQQEISEISRALKGLAKELNIPVVALSQLSRKVEDREEKRPALSDLRESGALEQDADVVMFLYRPKLYEPPDPVSDKPWTGEGITPRVETMEILVRKHRNGPTGSIEVLFMSEFTHFETLDHARKGA